jgi:hypothetical protein
LCLESAKRAGDLVIRHKNDDAADEIIYDLVVSFGLGRAGGTIAQLC